MSSEPVHLMGTIEFDCAKISLIKEDLENGDCRIVGKGDYAVFVYKDCQILITNEAAEKIALKLFGDKKAISDS